jgi:hypothetical protein
MASKAARTRTVASLDALTREVVSDMGNRIRGILGGMDSDTGPGRSLGFVAIGGPYPRSVRRKVRVRSRAIRAFSAS